MFTNHFEVAIAAHYVPDRTRHLAAVLLAMADWPVASLNVTVDTNDMALAENAEIVAACRALRDVGHAIAFAIAGELEHPYHLTWVHKDRLRKWHQAGGNAADCFIYLEDDIVLTAENLSYFLRCMTQLEDTGSVPGFIRYEESQNGPVATDFLSRQLVRESDIMQVEGRKFVAPQFPYWAGFILNRELAGEYLASAWIERDVIENLPQLRSPDCRAQSAFGISYVGVPIGQRSRILVAVDDHLHPEPACLISHATNNYVFDPNNDFATIPVANIFQWRSASSEIESMASRLGAFARRVARKLRRMAS
ncbi:MAG: hypothetical protein EP341_07680 [Sphingomonadales bacterium]|nr:MAG: hypothetical protein EP341_07680 [Sphingomonadales bacterium]